MFFLEHTESTTMASGRDPPPFTEEQLRYLTDLVGRRPRDRSRSPRTHRARSASPGSSRRRREAVRSEGEFSTIIVILCYVMSDRWEAGVWLGGAGLGGTCGLGHGSRLGSVSSMPLPPASPILLACLVTEGVWPCPPPSPTSCGWHVSGGWGNPHSLIHCWLAQRTH